MAKDGKSTHYGAGGIEVIDVIKAKLTHQQHLGFPLGNAIKYQLRMMHKSDTPDEEARKAAFYSAEVVQALRDEDLKPAGKIRHSDELGPAEEIPLLPECRV